MSCRLFKIGKEGHVTGGNSKQRYYRITIRKQRKRAPGMWDILNKYNPNFQLNPWYDHQVHMAKGTYGVEETIVDAVQMNSIRIYLSTLRLFNHMKDYKKLYRLANASEDRHAWRKIGAIYEVARMFFRVRPMDLRFKAHKTNKYVQMSILKDMGCFPEIQKKWKVYIPFNEHDIWSVKYDYS